MNTKLQQSRSAGSAGDIAKYAAALLLVAAGLVAFYWFDGQWPTSLRILAVVAGLVAATLVFMTTGKGGNTREFLSEARFELRKVVWPTRQEAMRTTWVVIGVVIVLSLLLAFFDVIVQAAVKWLLAR
jgi:preprotein translocase subunit SecE